jgi:ketosteroid isomerase-like protein
LDRRSDVFSLGCALFELVTFVPAFVGSTKDIVTQISSGPVPGLRQAMPDLDPGLDALARRAMALDPAERYADLDELRAELAAVRRNIDPAYDPRVTLPGLVGEEVASAPTMLVSAGRGTFSSSVGRRFRSQRRRGLIAAAILATTLAAASVFWMLRPTGTIPEGAGVQTRPGLESIEQKPVAIAPAPAAVPPTNPATPSPTDARDKVTPPAVGDRSGDRGSSPTARAEPQRSTVVPLPTAEGPVQPQQPPPASVDGAGGEQRGERTAAGAPENVPIAPTTAPAPIAEPPRVALRSDQEAVRDTLRRYEAAYRALDVSGLLRVYPSLARDQAELQRTFETVKQYEVEIRSPQIAVQADTATVRATLARRITPKVGSPVVNEVASEFRLRREGSTWLIAAVTAR